MTNDELITECAMKVKPELWGEQSRMPYKGVNVLYTEYMRRRAELINEPDDADATDTPAKYTAQDANGEWWWYNTTPYIIEEHAVWDSDGWQMLAARGKVPAGQDWRTTLRKVESMTTTPNAPKWPQHPAHKAQDHELNPATSRLTDSQARQFAEECGTCSDGTQCGTFAETAYCDDCPNRPQPEYDPDDVAFTSDPINPNHCRAGKVECIDALESATINKRGIEAVCTANAIKYLWRYESKGGLEDVRKARWYLDRLAQHLGD